MAYYLRKDKTKKENDLYLQIYSSKYDPIKKQTKSMCYKSIGLVSKLTTKEIPDPIKFWEKKVREMNLENKAKTKRTIYENKQTIKNIGYSIIKWMIDKLNVRHLLKTLNITYGKPLDISNFIEQMIYARLVQPCSKLKTCKEIVPLIFGAQEITKHEVYEGIKFIGSEYKKIIDLFNLAYSRIYKRNTNNIYFDCTNYYFEIDVPNDDKQKGPSKERSANPIIGQALLLDGDKIPLAMQMYPGNKSEKQFLRTMVNEIKEKHNISGRTIQVADKGLNCAANIYFAKQNNNGYIFSKSVNGKNLDSVNKEWLLDNNDWKVILDKNGKVLFKVKEKIQNVTYNFIDENGERISFEVVEKLVASFNPNLAEKKKIEIREMFNKTINLSTEKSCDKSQYGSCAKYVVFKKKDSDGNDVKITPHINEEIFKQDMSLAGYNLIVSSEINNSAQQIFEAYHNLWKIEESFKIMKSYLDVRPVYLQKEESIYGHFLICYLVLFLLRVLEIKEFDNKISSFEIINFVTGFIVCEEAPSSFINCSKVKDIEPIFNETQLSGLINSYLSKFDIIKILNHKI